MMKKKKKNTAKNRKKTSFSHYLLIGIAIFFVIKVSTVTYYDFLLDNYGDYTIAEIYKYKDMKKSGVRGYYEFKVNEKWYKGWTTTLNDEKIYKKIPYDTLTILYLPSNPEINRSKNGVEKDLFVMLVNLFK